MKTVKRAAAALSALIMTISLASCGQDASWIAKKGDTTIPVGVYIYYLDSAANEAKTLVADPTVEVMKQKVEDQDAREWMLNTAKENVQRMIAADEWMAELKVEMDAEEKKNAQLTVDQYWDQYGAKDNYEKMGVAKTSFQSAYYQSVKESSIFKAIYDKGGSKEVSQADIEKYYVENYYNISVISVALTDSETQEAIPDAEKTALQTKFAEYKTQLEGGKTFAELETAHTTENAGKADDEQDGITFGAGLDNPIEKDTTDENTKAIQAMKTGEIKVINDGSYLYLIVKNDVEKNKTAFYNDDSKRINIVTELKNEEFQKELDTRAEKLEGVTFNQAALNKYQPKNPPVDEPSSSVPAASTASVASTEATASTPESDASVASTADGSSSAA